MDGENFIGPKELNFPVAFNHIEKFLIENE